MSEIMDIRKEYLNFFKNKGHKVMPSAPLVPDDATLLFTNAGMVPFKNIFTGEAPRPTPPIYTSCQTCIRAGGKHNDLDNVGYTARHHTFFEMLGNFSFGEYFKKEVIGYAWEFITEVLKLPKDRLYVTVHEKDDEAYQLWQRHIDKERIYKFGDKDNFWAMGDTGPCGPCSEIFYDQGSEHFNSPEDYMGGDGDRFLEIWNLVFMQYERSKDGKLSPLPKPSIDTGMGLERVMAIKEGKFSNYDSSLFMPLIKEVEKICGKPYIYEEGASYRVISDHIRSAVFLLAQGVGFDREGRGYVLRRILRRALRHGYLLGIKEPFMYKLVDKVVELMGGHYLYLNERASFVKEQILAEEERFLSTIANGLELFNDELSKTKDVFSAKVAFKLYDTYGFPLDLTADMLREKGLSVDEDKFNELMQEQKDRAKASWKGSGDRAIHGDFKELLNKFGANQFVGYDSLKTKSQILALLDEEFKRIDQIKKGESGWVMLDKTPFYATSGGQSSDFGKIEGKGDIDDVIKHLDINLAHIKAVADLNLGENVVSIVDESRRDEIAKHHSATHLLQYALKQVLGDGVSQAGSLVESNKLRFDFTFNRALKESELNRIEKIVNEMIFQAIESKCEVLNLKEAKESGAIALFGEKYKDKVRVQTIGESKELCGGTHVKNSSAIGTFIILKEGGISAGVRRIEAICGRAALKYIDDLRAKYKDIELALKGEPLQSIEKLKDELRKAHNEIKNISMAKSLVADEIKGIKVVVDRFNGDIKTKIDELKNSNERIVVFLLNSSNDKIALALGVKNAPIKAGELIKEIAAILGGGGGGRDDFATAGGKDPSKIEEALKFTKKAIKEKLKNV